ncbi:MAG: hypothetical protein ACRDH5_18990, partial [bacterium]
MNTRTLALMMAAVVGLGAALGPAVSGDERAETPCASVQTAFCEGHLHASQVVNPAWWLTPADGVPEDSDPFDDSLPVWLHLRSSPNAPDSDYEVTMAVTGNVVGSVDVFKVRRDFNLQYTRDRVTPKCPQDLVYDLLPA